MLTLSAGVIPASEIAIVADPAAGTRENWAASELSGCLGALYPGESFPVVGKHPQTRPFILLSSDPGHPLIKQHVPVGDMDEEGEFSIRRISDGSREIGIIAGNSPRAVLDGVYSLLEQKLGHGF